MKLLLLVLAATLRLSSAFNASLERRTPSRRELAVLRASQMEQFERAVECAGKIRSDQIERPGLLDLSPA
jgi:hypothetical protein